MTATLTEWTFLRSDDFAGIVTPARGVPEATARPDEIIVWRLANRRLLVDTEAGVVCRADGVTRAEVPQPNGIGRVCLGRIWGKVRMAQAHRVVWVAKHGPIPGLYQIAHRNGHRWDNRIANLTIVTHAEAMAFAAGTAYLGPDVNGEDDRPYPILHHTQSVIDPRKRRRQSD